MDLSIVIPTYNGMRTLPTVLESIARQEGIEDYEWEVVVVDNNSSPPIRSSIEALWGSLGKPIELKVISERKKGAYYARLTGVSSAQGELLLLCDDDNALHSQFCAIVLQLMEQNPACGLLGSYGVAKLESDPPDWFDELAVYYAAEGPLSEPNYMENVKGCYTACLTVRSQVFKRLEVVSYNPLLTGRINDSLVAGEDIEFCKAARLAGYLIYRDSRLLFDHLLPSNRLNPSYAKKLSYAMGVARARHRAYDYFLEAGLRPFQDRIWRHEIVRILKNGIKSILHLLRSRSVDQVEDRVRVRYAWEWVLLWRRYPQFVSEIRELNDRLKVL